MNTLLTYLDVTIVAGRSNPLAVGAEAKTIDRRAVALVGEDAAFTLYIPQL
jgi:hypothetical protein